MSDKPLAWLVTAPKKPRFVRACWTTPPTQDQLTVAECDGDIVTPLYAAPQAQEPPKAWAKPVERGVFGRPPSLRKDNPSPQAQEPLTLTDEQINAVMESCLNDWDWQAFARAIERAHGIGGKQ